MSSGLSHFCSNLLQELDTLLVIGQLISDTQIFPVSCSIPNGPVWSMYLFGYGGQAGANSVKGQVCLNQGQRSDVVEGTTNRSHLACIQRDAWPWFGNRACDRRLLQQQWLCFGCVCGASTSGFQNMKPQSCHWIANHVCTQDSAIVAGVNFRSEMDYNVAGMFSIYDYWWVCLQMFYFVGTMEGVSGVTKLSEYLCLLDDGWRWWPSQQHHPCCICTCTKLRGGDWKTPREVMKVTKCPVHPDTPSRTPWQTTIHKPSPGNGNLLLSRSHGSQALQADIIVM